MPGPLCFGPCEEARAVPSSVGLGELLIVREKQRCPCGKALAPARVNFPAEVLAHLLRLLAQAGATERGLRDVGPAGELGPLPEGRGRARRTEST